MIFKNGIKLCGNIIIATIISVFLCFSLNVICHAAFTDTIGYTAYVYETAESTEPIAEYEYLYTDNNGDGRDDGTDTKMKEYKDKDYIVETQKIRSNLTGSGMAVFLITTQLLCMIMIISFASTASYKQGFKDSNMVRLGHRKKDILKGFKIGLVGNIPFFVIALLMIAATLGLAPNFKTTWYAFISGHFYSFIVWITNGAEKLGDVGVLQHVLLVILQLIVPAISGVAYILGFKEINLTEKLVYKKEVE